MTDLSSDFLRLERIWFYDRPTGIVVDDFFKATGFGPYFDSELSSKIKNNHDKNLIEPIGRVSQALIEHALALADLKASSVGAPTRLRGAVPASTINFLAWEMLVRCHVEGLAPPITLLKLIRLQLGIRSQQSKNEEEELSRKRDEASLMAYRNPDASFRDIAKHVELDVSTIARWNKERDLRASGKHIHQVLLVGDDIQQHLDELMAPQNSDKFGPQAIENFAEHMTEAFGRLSDSARTKNQE